MSNILRELGSTHRKNLVLAFSLKHTSYCSLCYKTLIREQKASAPRFPWGALTHTSFHTGCCGHLAPSCVAAMLSPKKGNIFHSNLEASKQDEKHKWTGKVWSIHTKPTAALGKDLFPKTVRTFDIKHMDHGIKFPLLFRYPQCIGNVSCVTKHGITQVQVPSATQWVNPCPLPPSTYPQAFQCESFQAYWLYLERTNPRPMISEDIVKEWKSRQYHQTQLRKLINRLLLSSFPVSYIIQVTVFHHLP